MQRRLLTPTGTGTGTGQGLVVLDAADPLPAGLADGTVILRRSPEPPPVLISEGFAVDSPTWPEPWTTNTAGGSTATVTAGTGRLLSGTGAYTPVTVTHLGGAANADLTLRFRTDALTERYFEARLRRSTDGTTYYRLTLSPTYDSLALDASGGASFATATYPMLANTWYRLRYQVLNEQVRARVWPDGAAEPGSWTVGGTNTAVTAGQAVALRWNNGADAVVSELLVDDVTVTAL